MFDDITEKHREIEKIVLKNAHKSYLYTKFICVIIHHSDRFFRRYRISGEI